VIVYVKLHLQLGCFHFLKFQGVSVGGSEWKDTETFLNCFKIGCKQRFEMLQIGEILNQSIDTHAKRFSSPGQLLQNLIFSNLQFRIQAKVIFYFKYLELSPTATGMVEAYLCEASYSVPI
jgi:hypothetical protein